MARKIAEAVGKPTTKTDKDITNSILKKRPNYNDFEANNWIKEDAKENETIQLIDKAGGAIWLTAKGKVAFRVAKDIEPTEDKAGTAKIVLGNLINKRIKIFDRTEPDITETDLLLVIDTTFDPNINQEFFQKEGKWYRNTFAPTPYMKLIKKPQKTPQTILNFMKHLVSNDEKLFSYFLNWLAYMWQGMQKPMTTIILLGTQGSDKSVFFNEIIQPLFGERFTDNPDSEIMAEKYTASVFANKLFIFVEESQTDYKNRQKVKNKLKQLITNTQIMANEKFETIHSIQARAALLISSNESTPVDIEYGDRRFNVFPSNIKLNETDFLGLGSWEEFQQAIQNELEDFARYLYHYPVDTKKANSVIMTPQKRAIIEATNDDFTLFANALVKKDLEFFAPLEDEASALYLSLKHNFAKNRVRQADLRLSFIKKFGREVTTQRLTTRLKLLFPQIFSKAIKSGDSRYYLLP